LKIQTADRCDISQILKLKKDWYKEWRYRPPKGFYKEYYQVIKGLLESDKQNVIVAKDGKQLLGYGLACSRLYNKNGICLDVVTDTSYIFEIYVRKELRKNDIASKILNTMNKHFKSIRKNHVFGIVYPWNKAAIKLLNKDRWELSGNTYVKKL
jgi:ribosomal protein S18 acetylase RimI-like enzyme